MSSIHNLFEKENIWVFETVLIIILTILIFKVLITTSEFLLRRIRNSLFTSLELNSEQPEYLQVLTYISKEVTYAKQLKFGVNTVKSDNGTIASNIIHGMGNCYFVWQDELFFMQRELVGQKRKWPYFILLEEVKIWTFKKNIQKLKSLVKLANPNTKALSKNTIRLYNNQGHWGNSKEITKRKQDTIHLEKGVFEWLKNDISTFFDSKKKYNSLGVPWHRGYLFQGPPGTGKTSTALALCSELDLSLSLIRLSNSDMRDDDLIEAFSAVPDRTIILLEDIDAAFNMDREKRNSTITFSSLLNAIDGIETKEGLIFMMTTNYPDKMDAALYRPGRADVTIEFPYLKQDQIISMFDKFFPKHHNISNEFAASLKGGKLTPAELQAHLIKNWDSPHDALKHVHDLIKLSKERPVKHLKQFANGNDHTQSSRVGF